MLDNVYVTHQLGKPLASNQRRATLRITDDTSDDTFAQVQKWLAPLDPYPNLQKSLKLRTPHTGRWYLAGQRYNAWKSGCVPFTWLYGSAGCGKTILSAGIIQDMQVYCDEPFRSLAFFFFDFDDPDKRNPVKMVKSLLSQFLNSCDRVPDSLRSLYTVCNDGRRAASEHELLKVLKDTLELLPAPFVVLDALDECDDWNCLLDIIAEMQDWRKNSLHVLLTSRREAEIESTLEDLVLLDDRICLESRFVDRDIRTYVRERLARDKSFRRWQGDLEIHGEIESTLGRKAGGMYSTSSLFIGRQRVC